MKDLEQLGELGTGTCGHVVKMKHKPSNKVIAVKVISSSFLSITLSVNFIQVVSF